LGAVFACCVCVPSTHAQLAPPTGGSATLPVASLVLPGRDAYTEADGLAFWALSPFDARRQVVLAGRLLAPLQGKKIRSIRVRRNHSADTFAGGTIDMELYLSHAANGPWALSEVFAQNRGADHQLVFDGLVELPAAPAPAQAPAPWGGTSSVTIRLAQPFLYRGGPLCIETVTKATNAQTPWWPIDAEVTSTQGTVTPYGTSCISGMGVAPAGADATSFTVGNTAVLYLRGTHTPAAALCMVGVSKTRLLGNIPLPLDLTSLGASGCSLQSSATAVIAANLSYLPNSTRVSGEVSIGIPVDSNLQGVAVYSQWAVAEPGANPMGFTFSNGVMTRVGASRVNNAGWLESPDLSSSCGRVLTGRFPILRFDWK